MRISRTIIVGSFFLALSITDCSEPKEPPLRIGIDRFVGFAPVYLARDRHIYEQLGVTVEPSMILDTVERTSALQTGKIDALCTTADSLLLAAAKGLDLVIVAAVDESKGADGIIAKRDITTIQQLRNRTVAFQEAMPSHFLLLWALEQAGLNKADVLGVNMNADDAGAAFISGRVDAAVTWEPWLSKATTNGGHILVSSANYPGVLVDVIAVRRDVFTRRRRDVDALVAGWMKAIALHAKSPDDTEVLMSQKIGIPLSDFRDNLKKLELTDLQYNKRFFSRASAHSVWTLGRSAIRLWKKAGVIAADQSFNPDAYITSEVVESLRE